MKIVNNQAIQTSDFKTIEKHFDCPLSAEIRNFLENYNGDIMSPEDGITINFITDEQRSISDSFSTIHHTQEIINQLQYIDYIEDFLEDSNWTVEDVEGNKLLPLMAVNGGSVNLYIALCGIHEGKLFVVDNGDYGVSKLSMTLGE